jgi:hypothetical protein
MVALVGETLEAVHSFMRSRQTVVALLLAHVAHISSAKTGKQSSHPA